MRASDLSLSMGEPLPVVMETSVQIAWVYLERACDLDDPSVASKVLLESVETLSRHSERRVLMLSNTPSTCKKLRADRLLELVT